MKTLANPPEYLRLYLDDVRRDLSTSLRHEVERVGAQFDAGSLSWQEKFLAFRGITSRYWSAFPTAKRVPELPLLACLFWIVTERTKHAGAGVEAPYWGVHHFNYPIIIGNKPVSVAVACWKLVDEQGVPVLGVVKLLSIVERIAANKGRPMAGVFEEVMAVRDRLDSWGESMHSDVLAHFGLPPRPPRGERRKVLETEPPPPAPDTVRAPPPAPKSKPRVVEPKAKPLLKSADAEAIREALNTMIDAQTEGLSAGDRARIRGIVIAHMNDAFNVLAALAGKYKRESKERDAARGAALARSEREAYERAVKFFGAEAPAGKLADIAPIKKLFRQQSLDLHPDRNPGRESVVQDQFDQVQTNYATITNYHAKQREEEERKAS